MAEWTVAYINNLPDSAFAYIESGGEKDDEGKTVPRTLRHFPHHDAAGAVDLPHLRNALSRGPQSDVWPSGKAHLDRHAEAEEVGMKAEPMDPDDTAAWLAGKIPRRLLAIPFGGPIPAKGAPLGVDLDGEYFHPETDIKPDWFSERPVLWHHGQDPTGVMGTTTIGKANNLAMEDDGWWVDLWLSAQEKRVSLVKRLVEKGAELFGSSATIPSLVKRGKGGRIEVWPYMEQTLTTSPQNTYSAFRAAKAVLADFNSADIAVMPALRDLLTALDDVRDLSLTSGKSEVPASVADIEASDAAERLSAALDRLRSINAKT